MEKMPFRDAQEVIDVQAVMASARTVTSSDGASVPQSATRVRATT